MTVRIVVGAQFGDEGKGKITDYLAEEARHVVRTGGGPNAGHSIHLPQGSIILHQLSAGVLRKGVTAISGPGMVLQPLRLLDEIRELEAKDLLRGKIVLSDRAHVLLPLHEIEDGWEDELRAQRSPQGGLGTTRRGIGPAYADRYGRWGIRMGELNRPATLRARLELLYERKKHLPQLPPLADLQSTLEEAAGLLAPYIQDVDPILSRAMERNEPILLEGAQSTLLDVDFGTYPFVTSSHPTSAGALVGSGLPPQSVTEVIGIAKAYATRVGAGPFPTRADPEREEFLQRTGGEHGATTGRPRSCGWLDLVLLRYVARLNGLTSLAITKLDVLGGLDTVPVCVAYRGADGKRYADRPPSVTEDFQGIEPVYEELPGWPPFHPRLTERLSREGPRALPPAARRFLDFVARSVQVPVEWVSFGARREETLRLPRTGARRASPGLVGWSG